MKRETTAIKDIAKGLIKNISKDRQDRERKIRATLDKAIGKRRSTRAQPVSFRRKKLVVNVDSSGLLYELTMKKGEITKRLKKQLKDDFQEIRFRIGEIED